MYGCTTCMNMTTTWQQAGLETQYYRKCKTQFLISLFILIQNVVVFCIFKNHENQCSKKYSVWHRMAFEESKILGELGRKERGGVRTTQNTHTHTQWQWEGCCRLLPVTSLILLIVRVRYTLPSSVAFLPPSFLTPSVPPPFTHPPPSFFLHSSPSSYLHTQLHHLFSPSYLFSVSYLKFVFSTLYPSLSMSLALPSYHSLSMSFAFSLCPAVRCSPWWHVCWPTVMEWRVSAVVLSHDK